MENITIERFGGGPTTLHAFVAAHGLEIIVRERARTLWTSGMWTRYYASIPRAEVMERGCLASVHGNGDTPEEAIAALAARLAGTRIAIDAFKRERQEVDVPNDLLTG